MDLNFALGGGQKSNNRKEEKHQLQSQLMAPTRHQQRQQQMDSPVLAARKSRVLLEVRKNQQQQLASPTSGCSSASQPQTMTSIQLGGCHNTTTNNNIDSNGNKRATSSQKIQVHSSTATKTTTSAIVSNEKHQSSRLLSKLAELRHRIGYRNGPSAADNFASKSNSTIRQQQQQQQQVVTCGNNNNNSGNNINGSNMRYEGQSAAGNQQVRMLDNNHDVNFQDLNRNLYREENLSDNAAHFIRRVDDNFRFSMANQRESDQPTRLSQQNSQSIRSTSDSSSGFVSELSSETPNTSNTANIATSDTNSTGQSGAREFRSKLIDDLEKLLISFSGSTSEPAMEIDGNPSDNNLRNIEPEVDKKEISNTSITSLNLNLNGRASPSHDQVKFNASEQLYEQRHHQNQMAYSTMSSRATPMIQDSTLTRGQEFDYSTLCRDEFSSFIAIETNSNERQQANQQQTGSEPSPVPSQRRQRRPPIAGASKTQTARRQSTTTTAATGRRYSHNSTSHGPMLVGVHDTSDGRSIDTAESLDRSQSEEDDCSSSPSPSSSPSLPVDGEDEEGLAIELSMSSDDFDERDLRRNEAEEEEEEVDYRVQQPVSSSPEVVSYNHNDHQQDHKYQLQVMEKEGEKKTLNDQHANMIHSSEDRLFAVQDYDVATSCCITGNNEAVENFNSERMMSIVSSGSSNIDSSRSNSGGESTPTEDNRNEVDLVACHNEVGGDGGGNSSSSRRSEIEEGERFNLELKQLNKQPEIRLADDGLSKMLDVYLHRMKSLLKLVDGDRSVSLDEAFGRCVVGGGGKRNGISNGDDGGSSCKEEKTTSSILEEKGDYIMDQELKFSDEIKVSDEFKTEIEFVPVKRPSSQMPRVVQEMTIEEENGDESECEMLNSGHHQQVVTNSVTSNFYINMMAAPHLTPKLDWSEIFKDFEWASKTNSIGSFDASKINLAELKSSLIQRLVGQQQSGEQHQQIIGGKVNEILTDHLREFLKNYQLYQEQFKANTSFATDWHSNWYFAYSKRERCDSSLDLDSTSSSSSSSKRFKNGNDDLGQKIELGRGEESKGRWSSPAPAPQTMIQQQQVDLIKYSTLVLGRCKPIRLASIIYSACEDNNNNHDLVSSSSSSSSASSTRAHEQSLAATKTLNSLYELEQLETIEQVNELCDKYSTSCLTASQRLPDVCHMLIYDLDDDDDGDSSDSRKKKKKKRSLLVSYDTSLVSGRPEVAGNRRFSAYGYHFDLPKLPISRRVYDTRNSQSSPRNEQQSQAIVERKFHKFKVAILQRFNEMISQRDSYAQIIREPPTSDRVKFVIPLKSVELFDRLPIIQFCAKCSGALPILVRWFRQENGKGSESEGKIIWREISDIQSIPGDQLKVRLATANFDNRHQQVATNNNYNNDNPPVESWPINMQANYDFEYQTKWMSWFRFRRYQDDILFEIKSTKGLKAGHDRCDDDYDRNYKCVIQNYCSIDEHRFSLKLATNKRQQPVVSLKGTGSDKQRVDDSRGEEEKRKAILRTWSQRTLHRPQPKTDDRLREKELLEQQQQQVVVACPLTSSLSRVQQLDKQKSQSNCTKASQLTVGHLSSSVANSEEVDKKFGRDFPYHPENLLKRLRENRYSSVSNSTTRCKLISRSSQDVAPSQSVTFQDDDHDEDLRVSDLNIMKERDDNEDENITSVGGNKINRVDLAEQNACRESEFRQSFEQVDEVNLSGSGTTVSELKSAAEIREVGDSNEEQQQPPSIPWRYKRDRGDGNEDQKQQVARIAAAAENSPYLKSTSRETHTRLAEATSGHSPVDASVNATAAASGEREADDWHSCRSSTQAATRNRQGNKSQVSSGSRRERGEEREE